MNSLVVRTAARTIEPLLLFFSVYLLVAGHDEPGGGFVGGLVASLAMILHVIAFGVPSARRALRADPRTIAGVGLVVALAAVWAGVPFGEPPMTGLWVDAAQASDAAQAKPGGIGVGLGTPVLFDVGVFLVVIGATLGGVFGLAEER